MVELHCYQKECCLPSNKRLADFKTDFYKNIFLFFILLSLCIYYQRIVSIFDIRIVIRSTKMKTLTRKLDVLGNNYAENT